MIIDCISVQAVGFVIGRHGVRVRQVEDECGARIRFKDKQGSEEKVGWARCLRSGPPLRPSCPVPLAVDGGDHWEARECACS